MEMNFSRVGQGTKSRPEVKVTSKDFEDTGVEWDKTLQHKVTCPDDKNQSVRKPKM